MKTLFSDNDFKDGIGWGCLMLMLSFATGTELMQSVSTRIPICSTVAVCLIIAWAILRYTPFVTLVDVVEKGIGMLFVFIFVGICFQVYLSIMSVIG